jgi:DNA-binding FadR family transcriptional regulator
MALLQPATNLDAARRGAHPVRMSRVAATVGASPVGAGPTTRSSPAALLDDGRVGRHVRVPKTAELVAAHLRRQIVRGELVEGDALPPEAVLMEQFGVSRPTLREAFRVLESEALISVRRGAHGGARVHRPDGHVAARYAGLVLEHRRTTVADVQHARTALEAPAVRRLAESPDAAVLVQLRAALTEAAAAIDGRGPRGDYGEDGAADPRASLGGFHHLLVELAGNQTLAVIDSMLRHILLHTAAGHQPAEGDRPDGFGPGHGVEARGRWAAHQDAHRRLVELIERGEPDEAEALWRQHLAESADGTSSSAVLDLLGG